MNNMLSTRCDPYILQQIKDAARAEKKSLRELIEHMRKQYQKQWIGQQIRKSYATMWSDEIALAEEDMQSYFTDMKKHGYN